MLRTAIGQITNGLFSGRLPPTSRKAKNHEQHNPLVLPDDKVSV